MNQRNPKHTRRMVSMRLDPDVIAKADELAQATDNTRTEVFEAGVGMVADKVARTVKAAQKRAGK